jgi:hypothetical protein
VNQCNAKCNFILEGLSSSRHLLGVSCPMPKQQDHLRGPRAKQTFAQLCDLPLHGCLGRSGSQLRASPSDYPHYSRGYSRRRRLSRPGTASERLARCSRRRPRTADLSTVNPAISQAWTLFAMARNRIVPVDCYVSGMWFKPSPETSAVTTMRHA